MTKNNICQPLPRISKFQYQLTLHILYFYFLWFFLLIVMKFHHICFSSILQFLYFLKLQSINGWLCQILTKTHHFCNKNATKNSYILQMHMHQNHNPVGRKCSYGLSSMQSNYKKTLHVEKDKTPVLLLRLYQEFQVDLSRTKRHLDLQE